MFVFLMDAVIILVQEDYFFTSGYSIRVKSKRQVIRFRSFTAAFVILSGLFASFFFHYNFSYQAFINIESWGLLSLGLSRVLSHISALFLISSTTFFAFRYECF